MTNDSRSQGQDLDTRRLERGMLLYYTQDGLFDLCLGACVVAWGLAVWTDMAALVGGICGVMVLLTWAAKRRVTYPRVGYAKMRSGGLTRDIWIALLGIVVLVAIIFVSLREAGTLLRQYFPVLFGGAVASVIVLVSSWFAARRFYVYAALIFLSGVVHQWGGVGLAPAVTAAGMVVLISGLVVFIRFMRANPLPVED